MHIAHAFGVACELKEQRRGDVVRQVADEPHAGREPGEVEVERVGLVHDDAFVFQARGEIAVELDHFDPACPFKQSPRKRPFARADLDDEVVLRRRERIDNLP